MKTPINVGFLDLQGRRWGATVAVLAMLSCLAVSKERAFSDGVERLAVSEMVEAAVDESRAFDVIEASIICSSGLPGSEHLDVEECLRIAHEWTETIRVETERAVKEFEMSAKRYGQSVDRFKAETLLRIVQDRLKVDYRSTSLPGGSLHGVIDMGLAIDSRHVFALGIFGQRRGTCFSMPFLYLALGRRLNYPLRLASAGDRSRLRWAGEEQFDLDWESFHSPIEFREQIGEKPAIPAPQVFGKEVSADAVQELSVRDELAMLLNTRGACLESHGMNNEALVAYAQAHRLSPRCTNHVAAIAHLMPKITPLFGHTAPKPAPDYSHREDIGMELNRSKIEWDRLESEYFAKLPPAITVEEQNERQQQRSEFQRRRLEAQSEILVRDELRRIYGTSPAGVSR